MNDIVPPVQKKSFLTRKQIVIFGAILLFCIGAIVGYRYFVLNQKPMTPAETLTSLKESSKDIAPIEDRISNITSLEKLSKPSTASSEDLIASLRNLKSE